MKEKTAAERGTRTGFTTGACSAAAARAAVLGLVHGQVPEEIESLLPACVPQSYREDWDRIAASMVKQGVPENYAQRLANTAPTDSSRAAAEGVDERPAPRTRSPRPVGVGTILRVLRGQGRRTLLLPKE